MRQAGVLAAAGIIALEKMSARLGEDHERAHRLAEGLANIPGFFLDFGEPASNMVFVSMDSAIKLTASQAADLLAKQGIRVGAVGEKRFRLVTHYWIDDLSVQKTIKAFACLGKSY